MKLPDWRKLTLTEGVLPEPMPDDNRIVLWVPGQRDGAFQHWERIGNVVRAEIIAEQGSCATPATSIRARQRLRGFFGKLVQRFQKPTGEQSWVLPSGESAEQCGDRQTDLLLVWSADETRPLDETQIRSRWPQSTRVQKLGSNLFVVSGVPTSGTSNAALPAPLQGSPREVAEQLLAAARQAADRRQEATALTDLGIVYTREGEAPRAIPPLEEALTIVRQLGDRSRESDVLGNLGLALVAVGQSQRALGLFDEQLAYARAGGDRFAAKIALNGLGLACAGLRDPVRALTFFEQALALAREVGDRQHEADLLWYLGIQYADLGQRDQAIAHAQATVDVLRKMENPQAGWFAEHLHTYRIGGAGLRLAGTAPAGPSLPPGVSLGGSIVASGWTIQPGPGPEQAASGPGLLRMAISATKAMIKFVGSGLKTVPPGAHQRRVQTCAACEHHTGLRCRLCGCFTNTKAWMAHEKCPIGKWPS